MQDTGVRDANGERDVGAGYGCVGSRDFWNSPSRTGMDGKTVLRPIAYGSKVFSDTEMKYGAPKAEIFAVVNFVEKYRANLGSEPFKLRADNRALSWLKTYSMDQSYI